MLLWWHSLGLTKRTYWLERAGVDYKNASWTRRSGTPNLGWRTLRTDTRNRLTCARIAWILESGDTS